MACFPCLMGPFEFFCFADFSALESKVIVFGFWRFLYLEFNWANKSLLMKEVDSNQSMNTFKFAASSR